MARPSTITREMVDFIRGRLANNADLSAKDIYSALGEYVAKLNEKRAQKRLQPLKLPTPAAVTKRITKERPTWKEVQDVKEYPRDALWSMVTLAQYPLHELALNYVIALKSQMKDVSPSGELRMTIRLAQWIDIIYPIVYAFGRIRNQNLLDWVFPIAYLYARKERFAEVFKNKNGYYDSSELDELIYSQKFFGMSDDEKVAYFLEHAGENLFPKGE